MKGRARSLLEEFRQRFSGAQQSFVYSRLILMARVDPDKITQDTDDPAIEQRLQEAIEKIVESMPRKGGTR